MLIWLPGSSSVTDNLLSLACIRFALISESYLILSDACVGDKMYLVEIAI